MSDNPMDIQGWEGVDYTTDPFILGKKAPNKSSLAFNYRAKQGVRVCRNGLTPIIDFSGGNYLKKSGAYFPPGSKAILPFTKNDYENTFYLAGLTEFTIEFWYRAEYQAYDRTIFTVPCDFGVDEEANAIDKHLTCVFKPSIETYPHKTNMYFYAILGNGDSPETLGQQEYKGLSYIPTDGEWHHITIYKTSAGDNAQYRVDGSTNVTMTAQYSSFYGLYLPSDESWKNLHAVPHYYNHMEIGADDMSIAEFRIWGNERTITEINAYKDTELEGDEEDLITYVPFSEGTGKSFTDVVSGAVGHFHPQEPYVNDDYELTFTGYNCMAYPSLRTVWNLPTDGELPPHQLDNEEAAYDGGILWDTKLNLGSTFDFADEGVWRGTAQIRLRLRQLKEGVLCGRLGMLYDRDEEKYRLFFYDETNAYAYVSQAIIDEDWVGVEKTITVSYAGDSDYDPEAICEFYIDDSDDNVAEVDSTGQAVWGDSGSSDLITTTDFWPYSDTAGENDTSGAIGGSTTTTEMCIAFDLIFLRQWYDRYPADTTASFLSDTYDTEELPETYRYIMKDFTGYIQRDSIYIILLESAASIFTWTTKAPLGYVKIPTHYGSSTYDMDGSGSYLIIHDDGLSTDYTPKQDIIVKRVYGYAPSYADRINILFGDYTYDFADGATSSWGDKLYFNGAILSNLVNSYDAKTFRLNQMRRNIYVLTEDSDWEVVDHEIRDTITDDSPLQSISSHTTTLQQSRYLILGLDDRHTNITGYESIRARWCDGPVVPIELPVVRGIYRYTSEDKRIDRLLVAAYSNIWELDTEAGTVDPQRWAWLDRNDDIPVSFLAVNNRLLVMHSEGGIKLNYRGNWSRLGLEVPRDITLIPGGTGGAADPFEHLGKYAWVAQFYDSENDAFSGTIPVFYRQGLYVLAASPGLKNCSVAVRSCKDYNMDRIYIYRTLNYGAEDGTWTDLYRVNINNTCRYLGDSIIFRDVWLDDNLATEGNYLSSIYYGQDLTPPTGKAIGIGYNRVFIFNSQKEKSSLYWSMVDAIGFAKPDQYPTSYKMIVEEGDTTEGTALVEFSNVLFALKENAIFQIEQSSPASFSSSLIYKGVGCVNQRSVAVAGNSIMFIDRSGVYRYAGGEPVMLSQDLADYFRNEVNQDNITDKAFMLFNKTDDIIYAFVPSEGSTYCDRVIVFDIRSQTFTLDLIPYVTCGYVDHDDIYLGTPYGQVLRVSETTYLDGVSTSYSGTGAML